MAKTIKPVTDQYLDMYDKVKKEKGLINQGEEIFFSIFLIDEMESNWHKLLESVQNSSLKIHFSETIQDASVVVIDATIFQKLSEALKSATDKKSFDPFTYKYWEEYTEATKLGKRVIDFSDWNMAYHDNLTKIDEKMFFNIKNMLSSTEESTLDLAISIMSSTNRRDPETITHLKELVKVVNETKLKTNIDYRELVSFLSKTYD
jgi:hypothetical protein